MGLFGFGKSYKKDDLDREIAKLRSLYNQALINHDSQTKKQLTMQLHNVLEVCRKGGFNGSELVEWGTQGMYTTLRDVTPLIQVMLDTW